MIQKMVKEKPSLFGLSNCNRDFLKEDSWGKNQFNSSFPAALFCYMASKDLNSKYLVSKKQKVVIKEINFESVAKLKWNSNELFFSFESEYSPYQKYILGKLPRVDLVFQNHTNGSMLAPLEIKLTAIPDSTTCELSQEKYGSELVIRPDTIVYLTLSIISNSNFDIKTIRSLAEKYSILNFDFEDENAVIQSFSKFEKFVQEIISFSEDFQSPLILQPIWKTEGKSPRLAHNCLDCFIWSDIGFLNFNLGLCKVSSKTTAVARPMRSIIWFIKMLTDYLTLGHFSPEEIISQFIYGTRNDKAFSVAGLTTNDFMNCEELTKPRIKKSEIENIILGGGEKLLSPERRFDAIVSSSPDLFV